MKILPTEFDGQSIRRIYDEETEIWWFSVIDVVQVLTDSENARDYWFKMKLRVKAQDVAELSAADGKLRLTDVANAKSLLRTRQIAESEDASGLEQNKAVAQEGGGMARPPSAPTIGKPHRQTCRVSR